MSTPSGIQILHRPEDSIRVEPGKEPKLEVQKISTFLGFNGVYIIGKVKSGVIAPSMMGISPTGKTFRVTEIESKYPNCAVAKQGMTVGLSVEGVGKRRRVRRERTHIRRELRTASKTLNEYPIFLRAKLTLCPLFYFFQPFLKQRACACF